MAALASEVMPRQWHGLEPDGRGHELLIEWGRHRRGGERTHSPITSGGWSERLDPVHEDEPPSVVAIDRLLAQLMRAGYEHSVEIVKRFYLEHPKYSLYEVAGKVYRTEGFVRLTIRGVCALVEENVRE
jgi:hypothetical protein